MHTCILTKFFSQRLNGYITGLPLSTKHSEFSVQCHHYLVKLKRKCTGLFSFAPKADSSHFLEDLEQTQSTEHSKLKKMNRRPIDRRPYMLASYQSQEELCCQLEYGARTNKGQLCMLPCLQHIFNSLNMDYLRTLTSLIIYQSFLFRHRCFSSLMLSCFLDSKTRGENRAELRTNIRKTVFTCHLHDHIKTFAYVPLYALAGFIL